MQDDWNTPQDIKRIVFVLIWVSVLATACVIGGIKFYNYDKIQTENAQNQQLGRACLQHAHNMATSADANLKDIYSFDNNGGQPSVSNPEYVQWQATMSCLPHYPLFNEQSQTSPFNTTLN